MDDRNKILQYIQDARKDRSRHFGRRVHEIAKVVNLPVETVEFLVQEMERKGELSMSGSSKPGDIVVDI
ncbi:MAG: hypothetical protein L0Y44_02125 [Phycisphaerales bacterium]|nr:hypothetical protein [Phycisphaerales bacterium]MCI0629433.1 hypothetical protein [Phycisphaerales bacterium]